MEILNALGVNETIFIQLAVFLVAYVFLANLLFKPYYNAFIQRKDRTVGRTDTAERYLKEAKELQTEFENKARELNSKYKIIYDQSRAEALKEYDTVVTSARNESKEWIESHREKLQQEIRKVQSEISAEVKGVSKLIQSRLLGRENAQ